MSEEVVEENLITEKITYVDRLSGKKEEELIYGGKMIRFLYGKSPFGGWVCSLLSKHPLFSKLWGAWKNSVFSKVAIGPFIEKFKVDVTEFEKSYDSFHSFNDFFTRKLKPTARPMAPGDDVAIMPADGRYLFYPNVSTADGFVIKGKKFSLETLLHDSKLAEQYKEGTMIIARLCPTDYHRFHFPTDCTPSKAKVINGPLFSVNPIAIKKNLDILAENKRVITLLTTKKFGVVAYIEVGATGVGHIEQTFEPLKAVHKGDEKGFFGFGGSTLILLFEKGKLRLDRDLLVLSHDHQEVRCLMGQSLGSAH